MLAIDALIARVLRTQYSHRGIREEVYLSVAWFWAAIFWGISWYIGNSIVLLRRHYNGGNEWGQSSLGDQMGG